MDISALEKMLAAGNDSAMLRFSLASAYRRAGDLAEALVHAERALQLDPAYSAAWKVYAGLLRESGRVPESAAAYRRGIQVAETAGDKQAAREMRVYLKRLEHQ